MKKVLLLLLIPTLFLSIIYIFKLNNEDNSVILNEIEVKEEDSNINPTIDETPDVTTKIKIYEEKPAKLNATYFEKIIKVNNDYAYLSYPLKINTELPPKIIVYGHGSNTTVINSFSSPFMKDLQLYGEYFSKRGYAFLAPNFKNYTTNKTDWINQITDLKKTITNNYLIDDQINLIGYSKGAQPIMYYSISYPQLVNSVALLAPALNVYSNSDILKTKSIKFQIWHGNSDVNVPYSVSTDLVKQYNSLKLKNISLITLNGKGHFDIDTEYISDIYKFFQK